MSKNLRIDLEIGLDKARAALKQLQQEANQISRARGSSSGSGTGGGSGSGGLLSGLGLNTAGIAAGAAATAIAAVGAELKSLASRATELSLSASSATSQLGQLRSAVERSNISRDAAATSPAVVSIAKAATDFQKEFADALAAAGNTPEERKKALGEKLGGGLGGEDKETYRRMKEARTDLETDVAHQRQALDTAQYRQNRDYALQLQQFNIQSSRQKADLDKESARSQFDYTVARTKYEEDQAGKMAQKSYDLSRQFAAQNFTIGQARGAQDYTINRGRNQQDFGIGQARNAEDYQESMQKAIMGGASGMDLMWMNKDYRKAVTRNQQDFSLSQNRNAADFALGQGRAAQDYNQQARQAAAGRELEIENHLYERKYESLELETQHARALQDINTAYERLAQDIGIGATQLKNQGKDIAYDQNIANRDFGIETGRKLRASNYGFQDFAGSMRNKDPLAAAGQGAQDPFFAAALGANANATGQTDLFKQVNDSLKTSGVGNQMGDVLRTMFTNLIKESIQPDDPKFWSLNPLDWFKRTTQVTKPDMTNAFDKSYQDELNGKGPSAPNPFSPSINANVSVNGIGQEQIQKIVNDAVAVMSDEIAKLMAQNYGG